MAKNIQMSAAKRDRAGKGAARAIRREKRVPAVIYGDNKEPVLITVEARQASTEYYKGVFFNNLTELDLDGDKHLVLARDVQVNPIADQLIHIDFLRVSPKTRIDVKVPVHFINEEKCKALRPGVGTLSVVRYEIELNCPATSIPDFIEIDIENCEVEDTIKISNVTLPEGTTPTITDRDFTIASIMKARAIVEEETDAPEEDMDVEVVGEEGEAGEGDASAESEKASE